MSTAALAGFADWPAFLQSAPPLSPGDPRRRSLAEVLGVRRAQATEVRVEREWIVRGIHGRELTWSLGFGPRTRAFLLAPEGTDTPLPGVLALHPHGGVRSTGAEQLVDTGRAPAPSAARMRARFFAGRSFANDLARDGFVVLVPDGFSWASRAFDLSSPPALLGRLGDALDALHRERGEVLSADERFDELSALHEYGLAKAAGALGTSFAGAVVTDDLAAAGVLARSSHADADRLGVLGFSGGGGRALFAAALDERFGATAVAGMMATSLSLVPDYLYTHSWLLHSPGLAARFDLPDIAALGRRVLVQFGAKDELFPMAGMTAADARLTALLGTAYTGRWHDAAHAFTAPMQDEARGFLRDVLVK